MRERTVETIPEDWLSHIRLEVEAGMKAAAAVKDMPSDTTTQKIEKTRHFREIYNITTKHLYLNRLLCANDYDMFEAALEDFLEE